MSYFRCGSRREPIECKHGIDYGSSSNLIAHVKMLAKRNTDDNKETLGFIFGKKRKDGKWQCDTLCIPRQWGSNDSCGIEDGSEAELVNQMSKMNGHTLIGWIHTHPQYDAFFSSTDQHFQFRYQQETALFFGVVVSFRLEKQGTHKILHLTDNGMSCVNECMYKYDDKDTSAGAGRVANNNESGIQSQRIL